MRVDHGNTWTRMLLLASAVSVLVCTANAERTTYFSEDWEDGVGLWSTSNGVWEVGNPIAGTDECRGSKCAATNLDGNYPFGTNSRLESILIDLPADLSDDVLWLGFWHWFSNGTSNGLDYGRVQLWTEADGWQDISDPFYRSSVLWSPIYCDITAWAGQTVRLGFYFRDQHTGGSSYQAPGWFVDDIEVFDGEFAPLRRTTLFEEIDDRDWDGWYPSSGIWERGAPTNGPAAAHSGHTCFGTVLDGNYPYGADSRLISPAFDLDAAPADGLLYLSFYQYCSLSNGNGIDYGRVQIDDGNGWTTIHTIAWTSNLGTQWTEQIVDVSAYAGQSVRLGFVIDDNHTGGTSYTSHGWYIDDITFAEGAPYMGNPETFENLTPCWRTRYGVWEVGAPTSGPAEAHSPPYCWATRLNGNYLHGIDDDLQTPPFALNGEPAELYLRFWHWYSFSTSNGVDHGTVWISADGGDWVQLSPQYTGSSGGWTQVVLSLADYAGADVRLRFHLDEVHTGGTSYVAPGWYVDDVEIVGMPQHDAPWAPLYFRCDISPEPAQLQWAINPVGVASIIVYAGAVADFMPTLGTRLAVLPLGTTSFIDHDWPGWPNLFYRLSAVDAHGNESYAVFADPFTAAPGHDEVADVRAALIRGASPNPFNPAVTIEYQARRATTVSLAVVDIRGRRVRTLHVGDVAPGVQRVVWDGRNDAGEAMASGTYVVELVSDDGRQSVKISLVK